MIVRILTHPGSAHKDEFLACSVLLALHPVPIVRAEPTEEDLSDRSVCVVDVGHRHEPGLNNFDHHQLPKDHPPTCSLSLVLQHLELYRDSRQFCEWLETAEWFDCRGPIATAKWLGVLPEVLPKLNSPIDITLLRRFAQFTRHELGQPLWEMMRMIGEDLLSYVKTLRERIDLIGQRAEVWTLNFPSGSAEVLFLPRIEPLQEDPSMGLEAFIESRGWSERIVATLSPDRRGKGYGLSRYKDNPRIDFTRIANCPDVHFAHPRGFVAKTSATEVARLKELIALSAG